MAKGRPDWTSSINITGQDLEEVISRPKYGSAQYVIYQDSIAHGDSDVLYTIAGTGMLYGGYIHFSNEVDVDLVAVYPTIDGIILSTPTPFTLNYYQIDDESRAIIYEKYFGGDNNQNILGVARGITFEESWALEAVNMGSGTLNVRSELHYALI